MEVSRCKAYELIEKQEIPELNTTGYLLQHKKTKAHVAVLENEDENKVFNIGFRTPPKDSTGVAHIIEHTVMCGSREFPVKDPFIELAKGSLNTFLNAMTYPDKTVYPVASCNDKDFQNLMHVYLDAVFFPNIYKEEKIFRQEGWHYELDSVDAPIRYNGVVFNEMKGVFSSPDQLMFRNIQHSLFPDTPYGVESGGDPVVIPELTYENYLDFHRKYYHPSNSYIYLYGNMDMEEKLNWMDEKYLDGFDMLPVDSEIPLQKPFDKPAQEYGFYSVTEGEDTEGKAYFSYNVVCDTSLDQTLCRALQVLDHVLVEAVGAPVKQALMDAGIGTEISSFYENSVRQPFFSIIAKNVRMEQKDDFIHVIKKTLRDIADNGFNEKSLLAAINAMEFQYREADFGPYPKGLMYGLQMFDSWLYDDKKPFIYLSANDVFAELRENVNSGYYEDLLRRFFLENNHSSFVSIEPKVGLTAKMDKEEADKLARYKEALSKDACEKLVEETKALKKYQEEPTPPEDLKCIPLLEREDIEKKAQPFVNEIRDASGESVLFHPVFTNGIGYVRVSFDVEDLKEYAPYISLLTDLVGFTDTDKHSKLELSNEILLHAGGFGLAVSTYEKKKSKELVIRMEATSKILYAEIPYMMELMKEIFTTSHVGDEKRLREVIGETRAGKQVSLQAAGHTTASWRAMSYLKERIYYTEQLRGISYYDFLCEMENNFEAHKENLIAVLEALVAEIFTTKRMKFGLTADEQGYEMLASAIDTLTEGLPACGANNIPEPDWKLSPITPNEGFKTAGQVQYVARAGKFGQGKEDYSGVYKVVKTILGYDYLWNEVRVKGGAYDAMCGFTDSGIGYFVSYRDPNLRETNEVYEGIPAYLENFDADERNMVKYIIGTISDLDTPLTPRAKGERSYFAYITETEFEEKQKERDEILATNQEQIKKAASMIRRLLSDECICALGGEEKVEQCSDLFETIRVLK